MKRLKFYLTKLRSLEDCEALFWEAEKAHPCISSSVFSSQSFGETQNGLLSRIVCPRTG